MANSINNLSNLDPSLLSGTKASADDAKSKEIGKDAFLKLLIAQLKNQDPLEPQDQAEFATQLAQFSQVEQLTEINKKLDRTGESGSGALGLASYLGHEVILKGNTLEVSGGDAGMLQIDPAVALQSLKVDLLDESGNIQGSQTFSNLASGRQLLTLDQTNASSGIYTYKISATTTNGTPLPLDAKVAGLVTGFVPGPEQTLLVGGKSITLEDIAEVHLAK